MGVRYEEEKFDEYQDVSTLIVWHLDFTGDPDRWPSVKDTYCLQAGQPLSIGRAVDELGFRLQDPRISRKHAVIEMTEQGLRLTDLGSSNGTFLNGVAITEPVELNVGDQVTFDRIPFRVRRSLNVPELIPENMDARETAGLARQRLINARRQRLASEGKLEDGEDEWLAEYEFERHMRSRYNGIKPVMVGSVLALVVAVVIMYFLA